MGQRCCGARRWRLPREEASGFDAPRALELNMTNPVGFSALQVVGEESRGFIVSISPRVVAPSLEGCARAHRGTSVVEDARQ